MSGQNFEDSLSSSRLRDLSHINTDCLHILDGVILSSQGYGLLYQMEAYVLKLMLQIFFVLSFRERVWYFSFLCMEIEELWRDNAQHSS